MKNLLFIIIFLLPTISWAQTDDECATDDLVRISLESNSELESIFSRINTYIDNWIRNHPSNPVLHRSPVTIPVVIHVLYSNAAENISTAQIEQQLQFMNQDFRKQNASSISTLPNEFKSLAVDSYIQFKLAKRTITNTATTGITRTSTTKNFFAFTNAANAIIDEPKKPALGGVAAWDTSQYFNIWVCDLRMKTNSTNDNLLGYGSIPGISMIPGVVLDFTQFGSTPDRTWSHEAAHFLNLNHIWGDDTGSSNECAGTDHVSDTPNQATEYRNCNPGKRSCGSNDMYVNMMDYSGDNCRRMFTAGQRNRMQAMLAPGGKRASLAMSNKWLPPATAVNSVSYPVLTNTFGNIPSWKAALGMIHAEACSCSPDIAEILALDGNQCPTGFPAIPLDVYEVIHGLALHPEEIRTCFNPEGFMSKLASGPMAILSIKNNEYYGLVISGMTIAIDGTASLSINDPMNIGPNAFGLSSTGSTYTVDYLQFMTNHLERAAAQNSRLYMVYANPALLNSIQ